MHSEDNLVYLNMVTRLDIPAERVLHAASEADLKQVVILGYDEDGNEYFTSSIADGGTVLWLLKRCEHALLDAGKGIEE